MNKIIKSIMTDMLPNIDNSDSYKITINDHRVLRMWLLETKDKIEGYNKLSQNN
jgi:hypothetical protein